MYHTVDSNELVNKLLNEEAKKKDYFLRWDSDLTLKKLIVIHVGGKVNVNSEAFPGMMLKECDIPSEVFKYHLFEKGENPSAQNEYNKASVIYDDIDLVPYYLITVKGELTGTFFVEASNDVGYLGDHVKPLKDYLQSKDYSVGDMDNSALLDFKTGISKDMNIIVMKKHTVVIDMDGKVLASDVDTEVIAAAISELTAIETSNVLVEIVVNDEGYVISIIVVLADSDSCERVVASVSDVIQEDNCAPSILCHSQDVRIVVGDLSSSARNYLHFSLMVICMLIMWVIHI